MGPIIITRDGMGRSAEDPTPKDIDREFVMLYHAVDENSSPYMPHNIYTKITKPALGLGGKETFGAVVPGEIPFGHLDRAVVLQALVKAAASGLGSGDPHIGC